MSISLQKGQKVSLSKDNAGLAKVIVGLGWDEVKSSSGGGLFSSLFKAQPKPIDCDASAIMLKNGKFVDQKDLVYYGHCLQWWLCVLVQRVVVRIIRIRKRPV